MKAHYVDIGIVHIIRQRLKDIELQAYTSINMGRRRKGVVKQSHIKQKQCEHLSSSNRMRGTASSRI